MANKKIVWYYDDFFAPGHYIDIEDIPGVDKTKLANTLVKLLGLKYPLIQFTSDALIADSIGNNIFDVKIPEVKISSQSCI